MCACVYVCVCVCVCVCACVCVSVCVCVCVLKVGWLNARLEETDSPCVFLQIVVHKCTSADRPTTDYEDNFK